MKQRRIRTLNRSVVAIAVALVVFATTMPAQNRKSTDRYSDKLISINVAEIVLEAINFRDQTARMNIALDITNALIPISLKDFEYRLRLYGLRRSKAVTTG